MLCPFKFSHYEFEGGQDCIGSECGMHKLCANDTLAAENDVSEASVDANDGSKLQDSREKLEADVYSHIAISITPNKENDGVLAPYATVLEWLDRQAAITERDLCRQCSWPSLAAQPDCESQGRIVALTAKVDELTAERDALTNAINELQKKQPYCYNPEQPMDTLNTIGRYIDELTAERDALADDLLTCNKEREQYRELFSKAITQAAEIVNLQP